MVTFKLSNAVLHRQVQILQLAMITGTDIAILLRQMQLQASTSFDDSSNDVELVFTPEYDAEFNRMLDELTAKADEIILQSRVKSG